MVAKQQRSAWIVVAVLLVILASVWQIRLMRGDLGVSESPASADGHRLMLEQLEVIRQHTLQNDPVFGAARLGSARRRLANLPPNAPLGTRINSYATVGDLELLAGETAAAAEHLSTAYDLLAQVREQVPAQIECKALLDVAVAHLRLGEVQNCVECNTCDSCILPIREAGIHSQQDASRKAIGYLTRLLELQPDHLTARWLLNIASMTVGEYPDSVPDAWVIPAEAFEAGSQLPRFINQANAAGLDTVTLSGGVIADDLNGDGWIDIMTSDWAADGQLRYFRNNAHGKFVEETKAAGLLGLFGGLNLVQADYDNDGDIDVLVLRGAWRGEAGRVPNSLLQNDGQGRFVDVTIETGLALDSFPTQTAAWADFDNDGDLDLFVGNEGFPCQLFESDGSGRFTDVAERAGVTNDRFTKGASWGDIDGDRYPDLYVSNYGSPASLTAGGSAAGMFDAHSGEPNRLFRNNRDGTFTDIAPQAGVTAPLLGFPTWFFDVNNDGHLDLLAASYAGKVRDVAAQFLNLPQDAEPDRLYLGDGQGGFTEVARQMGMERVSSAMGANFGDLDNDGFDDIYLGTGAPEYESLVPNILYHNQAGARFEDATFATGLGHLQKGHAVAFADLDNDGDQDLFCVLGGAYRGDTFANALFINPGSENRWIKVALQGVSSNRSGIGARIRVEVADQQGTVRSIYKWVNSGGSFGANPLRKEIGLGKATKIVQLEIFWPTTGQTQRFTDVPLDRAIRITEGSSELIVER